MATKSRHFALELDLTSAAYAARNSSCRVLEVGALRTGGQIVPLIVHRVVVLVINAALANASDDFVQSDSDPLTIPPCVTRHLHQLAAALGLPFPLAQIGEHIVVDDRELMFTDGVFSRQS